LVDDKMLRAIDVVLPSAHLRSRGSRSTGCRDESRASTAASTDRSDDLAKSAIGPIVEIIGPFAETAGTIARATGPFAEIIGRRSWDRLREIIGPIANI
jgi:hypothetical protein